MPTATLTSKGQITLPRKVREHLRVQTGDTVDFVIGPDGEVRVRSGDVDVADLKGVLRQPGRRPVTLEEMDAAIQRAHRPDRSRR
jgi:AbrB family looped-hinge helix DNA binding protein